MELSPLAKKLLESPSKPGGDGQSTPGRVKWKGDWYNTGPRPGPNTRLMTVNLEKPGWREQMEHELQANSMWRLLSEYTDFQWKEVHDRRRYRYATKNDRQYNWFYANPKTGRRGRYQLLTGGLVYRSDESGHIIEFEMLTEDRQKWSCTVDGEVIAPSLDRFEVIKLAQELQAKLYRPVWDDGEVWYHKHVKPGLEKEARERKAARSNKRGKPYQYRNCTASFCSDDPEMEHMTEQDILDQGMQRVKVWTDGNGYFVLEHYNEVVEFSNR